MTHSHHQHIQHETYKKNIFGFWIYIMTDCILFASFFAAFAVLHKNTYGGPSGKELFNLPYVLTQTLLLLTSSFTCSLMMIAAHENKRSKVLALIAMTFLLGAGFLGMELNEFYHLIQEGNSWQRSGFLSSFFTLVATHGLHITAGLLWIAIMILLVVKRGLTLSTLRRLSCFSLFWHFLDVVWIFIFTFVYLMGVL